MSRSIACQDDHHTQCLRRSCSCLCGHPGRTLHPEGQHLGVYCSGVAHLKCRLGASRCSCPCHHTNTRRTGRSERSRVVAVDAVFGPDGRRVCPDCRKPLVKKNPNGPGRYPRRCPDCANPPKDAA